MVFVLKTKTKSDKHLKRIWSQTEWCSELFYTQLKLNKVILGIYNVRC